MVPGGRRVTYGEVVGSLVVVGVAVVVVVVGAAVVTDAVVTDAVVVVVVVVKKGTEERPANRTMDSREIKRDVKVR